MAQLLMLIVGFLTLVVYVGILLLAALAIWIIVDAFLIPGMVEGHTRNLRNQLTIEMAAMQLEQ